MKDIPSRFIPDEPMILGDWTDLPPEEWPCENIIYVCHVCGDLSRGLDGFLSHYSLNHRKRGDNPMNMCSAIPADERWEPWSGYTAAVEVTTTEDYLQNRDFPRF